MSTTVAAFRQSGTMAWRSLAQTRRNPWELAELSIQPVLWVVMFALIFGGAVAGSVDAYVRFMLPGMFAMNAIFAAIGLSTDVRKGVYDRFRSLPIARSAPLLGRITADAVKHLWGFAVVFLTGLVLGFRPETGVSGVLAAGGLMVLVCLCVVWVGVFIGVRTGDPEKVQMYSFGRTHSARC